MVNFERRVYINMKKYLGIISVLLTLVITLSLPATVTQATEIPATEIEAT
jgi:hypothetical protein